MGERTEALVRRLEEANAQIIAFSEACSNADWNRRPDGETWTVGVIAHHVANGYDQEGRVAAFVRAMVHGTPLPAPPPRGYTDQQPERFAGIPREQTIDLLRLNGAAAASLVRDLTDVDLDRPFLSPPDRPPRTLGQAIEYVLAAHVDEHLTSMRSAAET
jgi:hypothetical protein